MAGTDTDDGSTRSLLGTALPVLAAVALVVAASLVPALSLGEVPIEEDIEGSLGRGPGTGSGPGSSGGPGGGPGDGGPGEGGGTESDVRAGNGTGVRAGNGSAGNRTAPGEDVRMPPEEGERALEPPNETDVGENLSEAMTSENDTVLFTVESPRPTFWRTGAYDDYTGDGWARSETLQETEPYRPPLTEGARTFRQVVTLRTPRRALPTAWQPRSVSDNVGDEAVVTGARAVRTRETLPPNTSYIVTSVAQTRDPAVLAGAGRDYPADIELLYTGLPEDVPTRLTVRTNEITADADNPYEAANAVEEWLESNKGYSLEASYPDDGVASEFVFGMDEGYCELFATAMVAMLRTQDIPARYVVGYSTGEKVGEDTYAVREMHAHAWVEVYFPDVGWVTFDPTPGPERLTNEGEAIANGTNGTADQYSHAEEGSPGERFTQNGSVPSQYEEGETGNESGGEQESDGNETSDDGQQSDDGQESDDGQQSEDGQQSDDGEQSDDGQPEDGQQQSDDQQEGSDEQDDEGKEQQPKPADPPPLNFTVSGELVPGNTVVVEATRGGTPVPGAEVLLNGDPVGTTNESGQLAVEIPYVSELNIEVRPPGGGGLGAATPFRALSVRRPPNSSYTLPTTIEFERNRTGNLTPGRTVMLTAAIQGVPVEGATVRVDGAVVGTTDAEGRINVSVPWTTATLRVTATRGETAGNATLPVATDAEIRVTNAVPGRTVAGVATVDGRPIPNTNVSLDGEVVARTDERGQFTFEAPYASAVTVSVRKGVVEGEHRVDLPSDATVRLLEDPIPGEEVRVVVTLEGDPVPDATVAVDGERAATTDGRGVATVTLPYADRFVVSAERGGVAGNATVDPPPLEATVTPGPIPVLAAGLPATAWATVGGKRVEGATVTVGDAEATTGPDGGVGIWLPLAGEAEVTVQRGELTATTTRTGLFEPWGILAGLVLAVGGTAVLLRRYGDHALALLERLQRAALRVAHLTAAVLVAAAYRLDRALRAVARGVRAAAAFLRTRLAELRAALPGPDDLEAWVRERYRRLRAWLLGLLGVADDAGTVEDAAATVEAATADDVSDQRLAIRQAWARMVDRLGLRRRRTRTPGEVARVAVDRGYPADAVGTLTDAFREVEYGRYDPSPSRLQRAKRAIQRIVGDRTDDETEGTS